MSGDVAESGHDEEMREWNGEPEMEGVGDKERAEHACDGAFPGFFWGDVRGERMRAEGATGEVGDGVGGPDDGQGKEEEAGAVRWDAVKTDCKRKWEGHEEKCAGGDACGGKRFD